MDPYSAPNQPPQTHRTVYALLIFIVVEFIVLAGLIVHQAQTPVQNAWTGTKKPQSQAAAKAPKVETEIILGGREHIWEIAFLPTKEMLFTERGGSVSIVQNGQTRELAKVPDVAVQGEGGLMGLAVDSRFGENHYVYTCSNSTAGDIRVARWVLPAELNTLQQRLDIVTGIPANPSGRHSGCRLAFGPDGFLWIGTGDSAQDKTPQPPQDPKSLGGKILRVARDGRPASNNLGGEFDPRIYSYGHRNVQGIAFFASPKGTVLGVSSEHGSDEDDELNRLSQGNFGWAPANGPYNEDGVPMTDVEKFPTAVQAIWSSGSPTQAPSGVAVIKGSKWKAWEGAVAMALLKDKHLKVLTLDNDLKETGEERLLQEAYGRLRAVTMGPDGALYVGSSNGSDDKILRLTPQ